MDVVARAAVEIELSEDEERRLRAVLRTPSVSQQRALRARIVLRAAEGATRVPHEVGALGARDPVSVAGLRLFRGSVGVCLRLWGRGVSVSQAMG